MVEVYRLFIGGLPETVTEAELRSRFVKFGEVVSVQLAPPKDTTDPASTDFVIYEYPFLNLLNRDSFSWTSLSSVPSHLFWKD
jgi:hypothetical protein